MPRDEDGLASGGSARKARYRLNCPVCGRWKRRGALLCHQCMKHVSQPRRNRLGCGLEEYTSIVRDLRAERRARELGLRLLTE